MIKHVAATVLYAAISLIGSINLDAAIVDTDDDIDADIECVEYRPEPGRLKGSAILAFASQTCGERIDGAWAIRDIHGPAAVVAIHHEAEQVAAVDLAFLPGITVPPEMRLNLLARALVRCRQIGALKVIVDIEKMDPSAVRTLAESHGYQLSRVRAVGGSQELEFYTDLYWRERVR